MTMYRCVVAHGGTAVGDEIEVPDGAAVSPYHFEAVSETPALPAPGAGDETQTQPAAPEAPTAPSETPQAGA